MPDAALILQATALAAVVAGVVVRAFGRLGPAAGAAAVVAGLLAGAWLLGAAPRVPPAEDLDRLLAVVLPAAVIAEALGAVARRAAWPARLAVAAGAAPALLFGSAFVTDLAGPGSREWSPAQVAAVYVGSAVVLTAAWMAVARLAERPEGGSVAPALAVVCAAAGVSVMLSGYKTAGELGAPLAAAVAAASLDSRCRAGVAGAAVVGLFGLLACGLFFGGLAPATAAVLFAAPAVLWLPEFFARRRGVLRAAAATGLAAVALALSVRQFTANLSQASAGDGPPQAGASDYLQFGK